MTLKRILVALLPLLLSGCGHMGALYLPQDDQKSAGSTTSHAKDLANK